jgi:ribonuclease III family protein
LRRDIVVEFDLLKGKFSLKEARMLNPLVLAFVGDAIYEVFIRTYLVDKNRNFTVHKLHTDAVKYVKSHSQSEFVKKIELELTEEENYIFKRGRNAKSGTVPKNSGLLEYRFATGFESLLGFLYMTEQTKRLNYILEKVIDIKENGGI